MDTRSTRRTYIHGLGVAVPAHAITQTEAAERMRVTCRDARTERWIRRLARQSHIERRHLAALATQPDDADDSLYLPISEQPHGPGMGARNARFAAAADDLVRRAVAGLPAGVLEQARTLVTVSCTHASSPGLERPIFDHTPVPRAAQRWNLGFMGCSAGLAALRLVHGLTPDRQNAIIVTCELSSLHFQYTEAVDQLTANMLFADGATAVALSPRPSAVAVRACESVHLPDAADQMLWYADDHGLRLHLSRHLADTLAAHLAEPVDRVLCEAGVRRAEIAHWLVHPGGPQILDAVTDSLNLAPDALANSRAVLRDYGNMSSSTIFFILQRAIEQRLEGLCVALAFGPGLTIEIALLEISRG